MNLYANTPLYFQTSIIELFHAISNYRITDGTKDNSGFRNNFKFTRSGVILRGRLLEFNRSEENVGIYDNF